MVPFYVPIIFFYQNQPSSIGHHAKRSQLLKQSLSNTLSKFYPLAGRIKGDVSISCNDSGALYVEAEVHAHLSEAIQNVAIEDLSQYLPFAPYDPSCMDIPLAVQISFFECGGTAIGVCISHRVFDLWSMVTFMNAWAATCRGESEIVQPNFDLGYSLFPPIESPVAHVTSSTAESIRKNYVSKRFVFDKRKLEELGELASSVSNNSQFQNPTRVEVVSAFIWKHIIDLTQAKSDTKRNFAAAHSVNLRPRMSPPLPDSAMGNFSTPTSVFFELQKDKDCPNLIGLIGNAIRSIKNVQNGVDYSGNFRKLEELFYVPEMRLCFFSSWCGFPTYKVDYGWGKPLSVCTTASCDPAIILTSTRSGEGIEAWICMDEDEITLFPSEFLSLANNDFSK